MVKKDQERSLIEHQSQSKCTKTNQNGQKTKKGKGDRRCRGGVASSITTHQCSDHEGLNKTKKIKEKRERVCVCVCVFIGKNWTQKVCV